MKSWLVICDLKKKPHRRASHVNIKGREGIPHCVNPKPIEDKKEK